MKSIMMKKKDLENDKKKILPLAQDRGLEQKYIKALKLMRSIRCMMMSDEKIKMYLKTADYFDDISEYKDSVELSKLCKQLAAQEKKYIEKNIYERAYNYKDNAKSFKDYKIAVDEFTKIEGYKDSNLQAIQCTQMGISIYKKEAKRNMVKKAIILFLVTMFFYSLGSPFVQYHIANIYMKLGSYDSALKNYSMLDCYKDSREKKIEAEKKVVKKSEIGKTVMVGNCEWIIIDKQDNQALLIKKQNISSIAYNNILKDITWEESSLRKYLNSKFINETFSQEEQKNIILKNISNKNNDIYGTYGGDETQDYVFVLDIDEAKKYRTILSDIDSNIWLRSPGHIQSCAAFLSENGSVMNYGYTITNKDIMVFPAMWFRTK
ncbi:DUF6273 domain-containing protein [Anaeromicropila populeti]|uniref:DUF6273 domain-containing protein n=1 Tax=Anaeromicropila populeti TaxID=37658 RepID=A0A1I6KCC7_9FIRM|nr:DUF6273 domain-containing protein [Anaeromicropila populeti]SFR88945.1 hypothetical protein SAMN05661086_02370 [Anaeromicropila populeti]